MLRQVAAFKSCGRMRASGVAACSRAPSLLLKGRRSGLRRPILLGPARPSTGGVQQVQARLALLPEVVVLSPFVASVRPYVGNLAYMSLACGFVMTDIFSLRVLLVGGNRWWDLNHSIASRCVASHPSLRATSCRIAIQHTASHHSTAYRTEPHRTTPNHTAPHRTAPHRTHRATPHHIIPHRTQCPVPRFVVPHLIALH